MSWQGHETSDGRAGWGRSRRLEEVSDWLAFREKRTAMGGLVGGGDRWDGRRRGHASRQGKGYGRRPGVRDEWVGRMMRRTGWQGDFTCRLSIRLEGKAGRERGRDTGGLSCGGDELQVSRQEKETGWLVGRRNGQDDRERGRARWGRDRQGNFAATGWPTRRQETVVQKPTVNMVCPTTHHARLWRQSHCPAWIPHD